MGSWASYRVPATTIAKVRSTVRSAVMVTAPSTSSRASAVVLAEANGRTGLKADGGLLVGQTRVLRARGRAMGSPGECPASVASRRALERPGRKEEPRVLPGVVGALTERGCLRGLGHCGRPGLRRGRPRQLGHDRSVGSSGRLGCAESHGDDRNGRGGSQGEDDEVPTARGVGDSTADLGVRRGGAVVPDQPVEQRGILILQCVVGRGGGTGPRGPEAFERAHELGFGLLGLASRVVRGKKLLVEGVQRLVCRCGVAQLSPARVSEVRLRAHEVLTPCAAGRPRFRSRWIRRRSSCCAFLIRERTVGTGASVMSATSTTLCPAACRRISATL